ncbi:hypothetical protein [Albidovulum sp.]|uniref:hypothetical protein n=1 Tax=Albidovulum sp. TaxID=1872424 RepID=UPI002BF63E0E|nr:hypothetical protein [Albidovulum sp.]
MRSIVRAFATVALSLALVLSGFAAASARARLADDSGRVLVLCSDGGLVQVVVDADGNPTGESHLCPDLAVAMIAALSVATPDAQLIRLPHRIAAAHQVALSDGHAPTHPSARDPPSAV